LPEASVDAADVEAIDSPSMLRLSPYLYAGCVIFLIVRHLVLEGIALALLVLVCNVLLKQYKTV
jgi:hypothetical protein